jgi:archaellum biogenesis ATPase FlaH
MDITKELGDTSTVLILVPGPEYGALVLEAIKKLSAKRVCYVTLNKTHESLSALFTKHKVNTQSVAFVDAISKTFKKVPAQTENCIYVSSPAALTELSIAISEMLKLKFDYLIFDSLTNLLIYQDTAPISKFVSGIVNKIREADSQGVFYALNTEKQNKVINECCMFVDRVVDTQKK